MKKRSEILLNTIGEVRDEFIEEADDKKAVSGFRRRRTVIAIAAAVIIIAFICTLPLYTVKGEYVDVYYLSPGGEVKSESVFTPCTTENVFAIWAEKNNVQGFKYEENSEEKPANEPETTAQVLICNYDGEKFTFKFDNGEGYDVWSFTFSGDEILKNELMGTLAQTLESVGYKNGIRIKLSNGGEMAFDFDITTSDEPYN